MEILSMYEVVEGNISKYHLNLLTQTRFYQTPKTSINQYADFIGKKYCFV